MLKDVGAGFGRSGQAVSNKCGRVVAGSRCPHHFGAIVRRGEEKTNTTASKRSVAELGVGRQCARGVRQSSVDDWQRKRVNPCPSPGNGGELETRLSLLTRNLAR